MADAVALNGIYYGTGAFAIVGVIASIFGCIIAGRGSQDRQTKSQNRW